LELDHTEDIGLDATRSLVSCKMSLKEQAILTQDEPEGREVAQAGD
jgi:hypothetical protein